MSSDLTSLSLFPSAQANEDTSSHSNLILNSSDGNLLSDLRPGNLPDTVNHIGGITGAVLRSSVGDSDSHATPRDRMYLELFQCSELERAAEALAFTLSYLSTIETPRVGSRSVEGVEALEKSMSVNR